MPTDIKEVFKDINVNVDTADAVEIASMHYTYLYFLIGVAVIMFIALGVLVWWVMQNYGTGPANLPNSPTGQN